MDKLKLSEVEKLDKSLPRQVLDHHELEADDEPVFRVDRDQLHYVVDADGLDVYARGRGTRKVLVPLFTCEKYKGSTSNSRQEDERLFSLLDSVRVAEDLPTVDVGFSLRNAIEKAKGQLRERGYKPSSVIVAPEHVEFGDDSFTDDSEVRGTAQELDVYVHPLVRHRNICVLGEPEETGCFVKKSSEDQIGMSLWRSDAVVFLNQ